MVALSSIVDSSSSSSSLMLRGGRGRGGAKSE